MLGSTPSTFISATISTPFNFFTVSMARSLIAFALASMTSAVLGASGAPGALVLVIIGILGTAWAGAPGAVSSAVAGRAQVSAMDAVSRSDAEMESGA